MSTLLSTQQVCIRIAMSLLTVFVFNGKSALSNPITPTYSSLVLLASAQGGYGPLQRYSQNRTTNAFAAAWVSDGQYDSVTTHAEASATMRFLDDDPSRLVANASLAVRETKTSYAPPNGLAQSRVYFSYEFQRPAEATVITIESTADPAWYLDVGLNDTSAKVGVSVAWGQFSTGASTMAFYIPPGGQYANQDRYVCSIGISAQIGVNSYWFGVSDSSQSTTGDFRVTIASPPYLSHLPPAMTEKALRLASTATLNGNIDTGSGLILAQDTNGTYAAALTGGGAVAKVGAGTVTLTGANTHSGTTYVAEGALRLANPVALASSKLSPLAGGSVTLSPGLETTVGGLVPNAGGRIDVGTGMITVTAGLASTNLVSAIATGLGDGSWSGTSGIVSTAAASSGGSRTVGWLDLGGGSLQVGFAAPGDTNLDWIVDSLDLANFLSSGKLDSGLPATWSEGDFNYDQLVDILDAASFLSSGVLDAGSYNPPAGSIAAVPEPSTRVMGLAGIACGGWQMVRRRRAR